MAETHGPSPVRRFGVFEFDPATGELRKQGMKIKLQGQPIEILALLLERPAGVVTREELQEKLWPSDTFVDFEHSLNAAVKRLRDALDDSADNPRFVETLPRRGYRFIFPVDGSESVAVVLPKTGWQRQLSHARVPLVGTLVVVLVVAAGYFAGKVWRAPHLSASAKIVVLPFVNLSPDTQQEYFSDALTEELISQLGSLQPERLAVIARTTAMQYKATKKTAREIGKELAVDYILESSVQRDANRVRITVQLIRARDEIELWSKRYERDISSVFALQNEIIGAIASQIQLRLTPQEQAHLAASRPVNPVAHEAFLRGRYYFDRRTKEGLDVARANFQQAIDFDPAYASAYAGISEVYLVLALGNPTDEKELLTNL